MVDPKVDVHLVMLFARVDPREKEELIVLAAKKGMQLSAYLRQMIRRELGKDSMLDPIGGG